MPTRPSFRRHPPYRIPAGSTVTGEGEVLAHAAVWIVIDVPSWSVRRQGHLHLISTVDEAGGAAGWRSVELSRHPLATGDLPDPEWPTIERGVTAWVEERGVGLLRSAECGLVSEVGESRDQFERRVRQLLAPAVRERIEQLRDRPLPRLGWRRRREEERRLDARSKLANELSTMIANIEEVRLAEPLTAIRRAEIGLIEVPPGFEPETPGPRDPMIGPPEGARLS